MEKAKLQIEINRRPDQNHKIYAAISLRGGYSTRSFLVDHSQFESNCAFYNVLFNYYRLTAALPGLHFDIQRAVSTISFERSGQGLLSTLDGVFHILFHHEYDPEKFDLAKQNTMDAFALHYKDGAFRAKYKGYEFSDFNKRFSLKQLIRDMEAITFADFVRIANALVVPGNACVYISGETDRLDLTKIDLAQFEPQDSFVRIAGYEFDPYLRQDAYVLNLAREDHVLIVEALDFLNRDCTNFTKWIITELLAEQIPVHEVDTWADALDASILFFSEQLRGYKTLLCPDNEEGYRAAHLRLLQKYAALLENSPEYFAIRAAHMMSVGVYIDQYLEFLGQCSYERFTELYQKADVKISEAQVVLRGELR